MTAGDLQIWIKSKNDMHYKITLRGKGYNVAVHELDEERFSQLQEEADCSFISDEFVINLMGVERPLELLFEDSPSEQTFQQSFMGIHTDACYIGVEGGGVIIIDEESALETDDLMEDGEYTTPGESLNHFFVCELVKGVFFEFMLDIEGEFDISKISPVIQEYPADVFLVTGLTYDGVVLEKTPIGEFDGSGEIDYYLSNS